MTTADTVEETLGDFTGHPQFRRAASKGSPNVPKLPAAHTGSLVKLLLELSPGAICEIGTLVLAWNEVDRSRVPNRNAIGGPRVGEPFDDPIGE